MENKEYSYLQEAIKRAANTFADRISSDGNTVLTDEDFEYIMKAPDIQEHINGDLIVDFEDGLAIGISVGYRMSMSHIIDMAFEQFTIDE